MTSGSDPLIALSHTFGTDSKIVGLKNDTNSQESQDIVWKNLGQYLETLTEIQPDQSPFKNSLDVKRPLTEALNYRICNNCSRPILHTYLARHIKLCLEMKHQKEKATVTEHDSKKRAREQTPINTAETKQVKPKKQKKEPASKPKKKSTAKNKGPVDVEKQCGVQLPGGGFCARSLTCKTHSMGAKRAVPGRSAPYDVLLAAYQHKNQVKIAGQAAKAQADKDEMLHGGSATLDSDEETQQVLAGVSRSFPLPLERNNLVPTRIRTNFLRMREMFAGAILPRITNSNGMGGMNGRTALLDVEKPNEHLFLVRAPQRIMLNNKSIQGQAATSTPQQQQQNPQAPSQQQPTQPTPQPLQQPGQPQNNTQMTPQQAQAQAVLLAQQQRNAMLAQQQARQRAAMQQQQQQQQQIRQ